ncbi:hypothetical protein MAALD49_01280 [Marinobacter shengliensis]|nr:hypothetical protein MAALD49_01280 [Marinobacter shengliensis]
MAIARQVLPARMQDPQLGREAQAQIQFRQSASQFQPTNYQALTVLNPNDWYRSDLQISCKH